MLDGGRKWGVAAWVVLATVPAAAQDAGAWADSRSASALLAPLQGSRALRPSLQAPVEEAVREALAVRGYEVITSQDRWGQRLVDCSTPECVEQALHGAGAGFAIVPAVWSRSERPDELTLTLFSRAGRSVNVSGPMEGDLAEAGAALIEALLDRRVALTSSSEAPNALGSPLSMTSNALDDSSSSEPRRPHAWKAGPAILLSAGIGAFVAVGASAAVKRQDQQLNGAAVGAWSAIG
ncbi:MAG: hypothetical protein PVH21_14175, partial [Myxococcales bacterium]